MPYPTKNQGFSLLPWSIVINISLCVKSSKNYVKIFKVLYWNKLTHRTGSVFYPCNLWWPWWPKLRQEGASPGFFSLPHPQCSAWAFLALLHPKVGESFGPIGNYCRFVLRFLLWGILLIAGILQRLYFRRSLSHSSYNFKGRNVAGSLPSTGFTKAFPLRWHGFPSQILKWQYLQIVRTLTIPFSKLL